MSNIKTDWRCFEKNTAIINKGSKNEKSEEIQIIATVKYGEKNIVLDHPSMTAVLLSLSNKLWQASIESLSNDDLFLNLPHGDFDETHEPANLAEFIDIFEMRMGSIVFAHTAIESYANEKIPEDYIYRKISKNKTEIYDKDQIERHLSLDLKLGEILPEILNIESPKGDKIWNKYIKIKELRDRIVHIKHDDRRSTIYNEGNKIWDALLNIDNPNFAIEAKEIISYYLSGNEIKKSEWHGDAPF